MSQIQKIKMVDLKSQYLEIKEEIDERIQAVIDTSSFINGPQVKEFETSLGNFLNAEVIGCANGTDALQIALMALELKPGDEVVVPAYTYIATAEVIALLNLVPVLCDVNPFTFNICPDSFKKAIGPHTKAVIAVHLFGQCSEMKRVMEIAEENSLFVVEDNAQAIGASITKGKYASSKAGTIGHIGTTSFFPSKNLGCYGDGGALITKDAKLAERIRMIANHGQKKRYYHDIIGVNSRLDSIQAAILNVKLIKLNEYSSARRGSANIYDDLLEGIDQISTPHRVDYSTHVFHQYTLIVEDGLRDELVAYLKVNGVPTGIYYPLPIQEQKGFKDICVERVSLTQSSRLSNSVMSLPIHTHLRIEAQRFIAYKIQDFFNEK